MVIRPVRRVGLLRIEDVAMGAGVGMGVSLLLWPRATTAVVSAVMSAALDVNMPYLGAAVLRVTGASSDGIEDRPRHGRRGRTASRHGGRHLVELEVVGFPASDSTTAARSLVR